MKSCKNKNIDFRVNIDHDVPEMLYGDSIGLKEVLDEKKLALSLEKVLSRPDFSDEHIDNPAIFYPTRKFMPSPVCKKCKNQMHLSIKKGKVKYCCSNVSCKETIDVKIID